MIHNPLNWTIQVLCSFLSALIVCFSGLLFKKGLKKRNYRIPNSLFSFWICLLGYMVLVGVSQLLISPTLYKISLAMLVPATFLLIWFLDHQNHFTVDPKKMFIFGIITWEFFSSLFIPSSVLLMEVSSGGYSIQDDGNLHIWTSALGAVSLLMLLYYCVFIFIKSPAPIKRKALLILLGGLINGILTISLMVLQIYEKMPGILNLSLAVGIFINSLSFSINPKLFDVVKKSFRSSKRKEFAKILPICASCKKIRDDEGNWHAIEDYLLECSGTKCTHGICSSCAKNLYKFGEDEPSIEKDVDLDNNF